MTQPTAENPAVVVDPNSDDVTDEQKSILSVATTLRAGIYANCRQLASYGVGIVALNSGLVSVCGLLLADVIASSEYDDEGAEKVLAAVLDQARNNIPSAREAHEELKTKALEEAKQAELKAANEAQKEVNSDTPPTQH